eukprot:3929324-Rhodomonas_salina.2
MYKPRDIQDALWTDKAKEWMDSVKSEVEGLIDKQMFVITYLPKLARSIPTRIVFKLKVDGEGNVIKYKSRV